MHDQPQVAIVLRPFHELGLTLCRLLALEGTRIIVLDRDPSLGEAFCQRLALEGASASYRFVDPDLRHGEERLRDDLADVYGRIRTLISFFEPVARSRRLDWLELAPEVGLKLVQQAFDWRLRLMQALTTLFDDDEGGIVLNVLMGSRDARWTERTDGAVADLVGRLMGPAWSERGIDVLQIETGAASVPGSEEDFERLRDDIDQIVDLVNGERVVSG